MSKSLVGYTVSEFMAAINKTWTFLSTVFLMTLLVLIFKQKKKGHLELGRGGMGRKGERDGWNQIKDFGFCLRI